MDLRFLVIATVLAATALPSNAEGLPEGPGKDLVDAICSECHTTERIAAQQLTKSQWADKVLEMLQEAPDVKRRARWFAAPHGLAKRASGRCGTGAVPIRSLPSRAPDVRAPGGPEPDHG